MNTKIDAVSRCSIDSENRRSYLGGPEWMMERQGMTHSTSLPIRSDHYHLSHSPQCFCERPDPRSTHSVVVGNKNLHGSPG